jgi:hypothetical protein
MEGCQKITFPDKFDETNLSCERSDHKSCQEYDTNMFCALTGNVCADWIWLSIRSKWLIPICPVHPLEDVCADWIWLSIRSKWLIPICTVLPLEDVCADWIWLSIRSK